MTQRLTQRMQPLLDLRKENNAYDFSEEDVRQWVDDLGQDTPFESMEALRNLLKEFNQTLLTHSSRFTLLELLRPIIDCSLPEVAASYTLRHWPLTGSAETVKEQVTDVLETFFLGYALSVVEQPAPQNLGRAIHRALDFANRKTLERARFYKTASRADGELIFELYLLAREMDCHTNPIEPWDAPELEWDSARLTNEKQFLRLLILQLLQPTRWWPGDADELCRLIGQWMPDLEGLSELPPAKHEAVFCVDLTQIALPVAVTIPVKQKNAQKEIYYFSLDPLIARLRRHSQTERGPSTKKDATNILLVPPLAQRMLDNLHPPTSPVTSELAATAPTTLTVIQGFDACHHWFSQEPTPPTQVLAKKKDLPTHGVAIQMRAEQATSVQVGELMAWHDEPTASPKAWGLAEVIRLHALDSDTMDVGLRFFSQEVHTGQIKPVVTGSGSDKAGLPCLLLVDAPVKGKGVNKGPLTLLALPNVLVAGTMFEVTLAEQIHLIELNDLQYQTYGYARWSATRIQSIRRENIG